MCKGGKSMMSLKTKIFLWTFIIKINWSAPTNDHSIDSPFTSLLWAFEDFEGFLGVVELLIDCKVWLNFEKECKIWIIFFHIVLRFLFFPIITYICHKKTYATLKFKMFPLINCQLNFIPETESYNGKKTILPI